MGTVECGWGALDGEGLGFEGEGFAVEGEAMRLSRDGMCRVT